MSIRQNKLPIAALERIDDLCAEFERKWQANDPPAIESLLTPELGPAERNALLVELLVLDVDYRKRHGETPTQQQYVDRFPDNARAISLALNDDNDARKAAFEPPTIAHLARLFPDLQITDFIGAGGMGAVYKARQEGLDRVVALKILPEEFGRDSRFALRFTREARTLARLSHPNIVSVFEFGNVEDTYYFLMEFIDGSTLRDVVKAGQLAPEHALAVVPHLCDALQYAHDKGVVHRDIKPENILMAMDGSVKIADFGLSRILGNEGQQEQLTATHQVMGTPRYMAPEQLEGAHGVDHRADIFSLGVVFYEMLTGELPIGRFAPPSEKVEIDVRLDEVVLRTLEKEPARRYQRASQIKSDVQSITSTDNPAFAETVIGKSDQEHATAQPTSASIQQQALAGQLLLTRRQLMERVKSSLQPLLRGQWLQVVFGIVLVALGAQCWARNTGLPYKLFNGIVLHVYGVLLIAGGIAVITRIKQIDYAKPVVDVRNKLNKLSTIYLWVGPIIGFPWWLMWISACVAIGFDAVVMYPKSLYPSVVIGVVGLIASVWLYCRALKRSSTASASWKSSFCGGSIAAGNLALDEIESAQIR